MQVVYTDPVMHPRTFAYESMGTHWSISVWGSLSDAALADLEHEIIARSSAFSALYSRFHHSSLIWKLAEMRGTVAVPHDLVRMLRLYASLHDLSGGKCNPFVGFALSDLGYDEYYSLKPKDVIRPVPPFHEAMRIVDDEHVELLQPVLIDLGAVGKGYFVDQLAEYLTEKGIRRFLVDGSGDVYYRGDGHPIRAGLEHPGDASKVIGVLEFSEASLCGSAGNRRRWGQYHHTIDPHSLRSPQDIIATWVKCDTAAVADGLATCLFFCDPAAFAGEFSFEYCVLNREMRKKNSTGFTAEFFTV